LRDVRDKRLQDRRLFLSWTQSEVFKNAVDERIKAEAVHLSPVTDDFSFTKRYDALSKIILPCAEEIFGRTSRYKKSHLVTSPKIQAMVACIS
jgi:tRNA(Glu) U13 pseudouridine synthase TruD